MSDMPRRAARADAKTLARRGRGLAVCTECDDQVYEVYKKVVDRADALERQRDEHEFGIRWTHLTGQITALRWAAALLGAPQRQHAEPEK